MITPLSWLERVPTYKEQIENLKDRDLGTYGFLGYPLLQSADIVMYGEPKQELLVPVGEDQAPHVELTREVVRRFDTHFGFVVKDTLFDAANQTALEQAVDSAKVTLARVETPLRGKERSAALAAAFRKRALEIGVENFFESVGKRRKFF